MKSNFIILFVLFFYCLSYKGLSQPVMNNKERINNLDIFPDLKKKNVYYLPPGDLYLASDNFGKPSLKFLQMRYTGSQATGDQGKINFKSLLQFTIRMKNPDGNTIREIKNTLSKRVKSSIELRTLPIQNMEALLIYASVENQKEGKDKMYSVNGGNFESSENEDNNGNSGEFWTERTYTLNLDNATSQLFWNAIEKGQSMISLAFTYYVNGVKPMPPLISLNVSAEVAESVKEQIESSFKKNDDPEKKLNQKQVETVTKVNYADSLRKELIANLNLDSLSDTLSKSFVYKTDAFAINVDAKKYPDIIKKVDINAAFIPPDFAVMEVRCYDFNNSLRNDLYAKKIEIEATGMNGKPVVQRASFYSTAPDISYAGIRFKYAVKMNLPYRYRIIEIKNDTDPVYSNWITEKNWNKIIDITTKAK